MRPRVVLDTLDEGVLLRDPHGAIRDWNPSALRMLGLPETTLRAQAPLGDVAESALQLAADRGNATVRLRTPDGGSSWIEITAHPVAGKRGEAAGGTVFTLSDVTARRQVELENANFREIIDTLRASHSILEECPLAMCSVDIDGNILRSNMAFLALGGGEAASILPLIPEEDRSTLCDAFAWLAQGRTPSVRMETRFERPTGAAAWCEITAVAMRQGLPDAAVLLLIADVTEQRNREAQLRQLAERDPLTGVHNRRSFVRILRDRLGELEHPGRRDESVWTLLLIDLDGFKQVNDTCGHPQGDAVLVAVATAIRERTRVADTVARLGGDEFAVLIETRGDVNVTSICEEMIPRIAAAAAAAAPGAPPVTASIGIVRLRGERNAEETLAAVDRAMYAAKHAGKARCIDFG